MILRRIILLGPGFSPVKCGGLIKYLGIYLPKESKDLYIENYKTLLNHFDSKVYRAYQSEDFREAHNSTMLPQHMPTKPPGSLNCFQRRQPKKAVSFGRWLH